MRKTVGLWIVGGALLLGVAVTAWAQVVYATCSVKFENTTPIVGSDTQFIVVVKTVATSKGLSVAGMDAAARRLLVSNKMKELLNDWLREEIVAQERAAADVAARQRLAALQGIVE